MTPRTVTSISSVGGGFCGLPNESRRASGKFEAELPFLSYQFRTRSLLLQLLRLETLFNTNSRQLYTIKARLKQGVFLLFGPQSIFLSSSQKSTTAVSRRILLPHPLSIPVQCQQTVPILTDTRYTVEIQCQHFLPIYILLFSGLKNALTQILVEISVFFRNRPFFCSSGGALFVFSLKPVPAL